MMFNRIGRFLIYGAMGLVLEVTYTGLYSLLKGDFSMAGKTFLVMFPIYGLALLLEPVHNFLRPYPRWIRGLHYLALIWTGEYLYGYLLQTVLGACPWHYRDLLNIHGLITLRMGPEWFLTGLGFEYLHDFLCPLAGRHTAPKPVKPAFKPASRTSNDMQNTSRQEPALLHEDPI